jgi:hypothetical protein
MSAVRAPGVRRLSSSRSTDADAAGRLLAWQAWERSSFTIRSPSTVPSRRPHPRSGWSSTPTAAPPAWSS